MNLFRLKSRNLLEIAVASLSVFSVEFRRQQERIDADADAGRNQDAEDETKAQKSSQLIILSLLSRTRANTADAVADAATDTRKIMSGAGERQMRDAWYK